MTHNKDDADNAYRANWFAAAVVRALFDLSNNTINWMRTGAFIVIVIIISPIVAISYSNGSLYCASRRAMLN